MRWLVALGESDIPCLMVPLVRTVELVRDPGSQPWITDGLIRTLSMEPTVDSRARQISLSIDVLCTVLWTMDRPHAGDAVTL